MSPWFTVPVAIAGLVTGIVVGTKSATDKGISVAAVITLFLAYEFAIKLIDAVDGDSGFAQDAKAVTKPVELFGVLTGLGYLGASNVNAYTNNHASLWPTISIGVVIFAMFSLVAVYHFFRGPEQSATSGTTTQVTQAGQPTSAPPPS